MKNIFNSIQSKLDGLLKRKFINRNERILIQPFHHIDIKINNKEYKIQNISTNGIAIVSTDDFKLDELVDVEIQIGEFDLKSKFKITRLGNKVIGAKVDSNSIQFENIVKAYFLSEMKGMGLLKLNTSILKTPTTGSPVLFYGDENYELYYIVEENKINFVQLVFKGYVIRYTFNGEDVHIGKIKADGESEKMVYKGSSLVEFDIEVPENFYREVSRFIHSINGIPDTEFQQIFSILSRLENFPTD